MRHVIRSAVLLSALATGGCGSDSASTTAGTASLSMRVVWNDYRPGSGAATAPPLTGDARGELPRPPVCAPFPSAFRMGRVLFRSRDFECCVAFDPCGVTAGGSPRLVLTNLPAGPASFEVTGFPDGPVPTEDNILVECATKPAAVGLPCVATACLTPSFTMPEQSLTLVAGRENNAGTVHLSSAPFLAELSPSCGGSTALPLSLLLSVADASGQLPPSGQVLIVQGQTPIPLTLDLEDCCDRDPQRLATPCPDVSCCSAHCDLGVSGFLVTATTTARVVPGDATVEVQWPGAFSDLSFAYQIDLLPAPTSTPTPTATSTPTPFVTSTPIPFVTSTPIPTAPSTPTFATPGIL